VAGDPAPYGRLIVRNGMLERIVESRDADAAEKAVNFCNSGVMCIDGALIGALLGAIKDDNVKREFYLTDAVAIARAAGHVAIAVDGDEAEFQGINSRAELAAAEKALQRRLRSAAFEAGVSMIDPDTVWLAADTKFAADVTIGPNVRFGAGVSVGSGTEIKGSATSRARASAATSSSALCAHPAGSDVADQVHIGNFVELKATRMGRGAKANHLAYLGDSDIGPASNIGAGTIAVNYDGFGNADRGRSRGFRRL